MAVGSSACSVLQPVAENAVAAMTTIERITTHFFAVFTAMVGTAE
jgi:hypothetical protein